MKLLIPAMLAMLLTVILVSCGAKADSPTVATPAPTYEITKTDAEWKAQLSEHEYNVLRDKGTERAFTGEYWDNHEDGLYVCRACGLPLYDSKDKFTSGTGWPSYTRPAQADSLATVTDSAWGMSRTELLCKRCGGHLGHVFGDGPAPTNERH